MAKSLVFVLFLSLQLAVCLASSNSNTSPSSVNARGTSQFYTVYPTQPNDTAKNAEIKSFLHSINDNVQEKQDTNGLISWQVSLNDDTSLEKLQDYNGIRIVELENAPLRQESTETRRAIENKTYMVVPKDPTNREETNKTAEWLKTHMIDKNEPLFDYTDFISGDVRCWGLVALDEAGVEEARKQPGIRIVAESLQTTHNGIIPDHRRSPFHRRSLNHISHIPSRTKRDNIEWAKQTSVGDWGLHELSRYKDQAKDPNWVQDFVYEKRAGDEAIIYVIEEGIEIHVKDESGKEIFAHYDENDMIQTYLSEAKHGVGKFNDSNSEGHGTMVASKALSSRYGIAKTAKLISVKTYSAELGLFLGYRAVLNDLAKHPERAKKAVVLSCIGVIGQWSHPDNAWYVDEFRQILDELHDQGIPVVVAAGNYEAPREKTIDMVPMILASSDVPLINVGASTFEGEEALFSQGGDKLTILAPGDYVEVHNHKDGLSHEDDGTSFAAPVVAGVIATLMNHEGPPWQGTAMDRQRVKDIRNYVKSPRSSWERDPGVNVIWNGADKAAWESVGAHQCDEKCSPPDENPPPQPPPPPENKNEGRTFVVGLQQFETPRCTTVNIPLPNQVPSTKCSAQHDFKYRYFFYWLENIDEVDSLCSSELPYFSEDGQDWIFDENYFENPNWPGGEWNWTFFGEQFSYKNDGQTQGALFKGDRKIDCNGDKRHHDPKSDGFCERTLSGAEGTNRRRRRVLSCKW